MQAELPQRQPPDDAVGEAAQQPKIRLHAITAENATEHPPGHTAEEQKYGVADKKVGPTDAMREEIRRMGPVQKLEYAELNLAPKKADRQ